jgi:small subunit ribosomal protein S20
MANHKSAIKRHRQSLKRREVNRARRGEVRTAFKKAISAISAGKGTEATNAVRDAESSIASAVKKGVIHRKTMARKVSRLAKKANAAKA